MIGVADGGHDGGRRSREIGFDETEANTWIPLAGEASF